MVPFIRSRIIDFGFLGQYLFAGDFGVLEAGWRVKYW